MFGKITSLLSLPEKCTLVLHELHKVPEGLSALQLSRLLNLPRSSIYDYVDRLIEAGVVRKTTSQRGVKFLMADIETIQSVLEEQKKHIESTIETLPHLVQTEEHGSYIPRFSFYDEKNTAELILRDVLRSREERIYGFWSVSDMSTVVSPELYSFFHEERTHRGIFLSSLWPHSQKQMPKEYTLPDSKMIEVREVPKTVQSYAGYVIYGNKVGFISSEKEGFGFIIDSPELSKTMKTQFLYLWENAKPV